MQRRYTPVRIWTQTGAAARPSQRPSGLFPRAVFIIDPWFARPDVVGPNRFRFLLECLQVWHRFPALAVLTRGGPSAAAWQPSAVTAPHQPHLSRPLSTGPRRSAPSNRFPIVRRPRQAGRCVAAPLPLLGHHSNGVWLSELPLGRSAPATRTGWWNLVPTPLLPQTFESDTEPYAKERDAKACRAAREAGVEVVTFPTHTLFDPERVLAAARHTVPASYGKFTKVDSPRPVPPSPPLCQLTLLAVGLRIAAPGGARPAGAPCRGAAEGGAAASCRGRTGQRARSAHAH